MFFANETVDKLCFNDKLLHLFWYERTIHMRTPFATVNDYSRCVLESNLRYPFRLLFIVPTRPVKFSSEAFVLRTDLRTARITFHIRRWDRLWLQIRSLCLRALLVQTRLLFLMRIQDSTKQMMRLFFSALDARNHANDDAKSAAFDIF